MKLLKKQCPITGKMYAIIVEDDLSQMQLEYAITLMDKDISRDRGTYENR